MRAPFRLASGIVGAAIAVFAEVGCRALRLASVTRAVGRPIGIPAALRVTLAGDLAAAVTPSSAGGEPARALALRRHGLSWSESALVLGLELATDLITAAAVIAFVASGRRFPWPLHVDRRLVVWGALVALVTAVAARQVLRRAAAALQARLAGMRRALVRVRTQRGFLALGGAAAAGHAALRFSVLPVLAWAFGVGLDLKTLLAWQLVAFYGLAFVPTPGGTGATEAGFVMFFRNLVPSETLAALLAAWRFFSYYGYALIGAVGAGSAVRDLRRHRGAARQDEADPVLEGQIGLEHVGRRKHDDVSEIEVVRGHVHRAQLLGRGPGGRREGERSGEEPRREATGQPRQHEALEAS